MSTAQTIPPGPPAISPARVETLVAELHATLDGLVGADLTELADARVVPVLQEVERAVRRVPAVRAGLVAEVDGRGIAAAREVRSTRVLLRRALRISPELASAYVAEADELVSSRVLSTGELLPPVRAHVAAAVREGAISHEHVRLIGRTLRELPVGVPREQVQSAEADLVRHARTLTPDELAKVCSVLRDCLDPDGKLDDEREQQRRRGFTIGRRDRHGLSPVSGALTDQARAWLEAAMEPLAAPCNSEHEQDTRLAPQRRHDALAELARHALAAGDLPAQAGLPATLLISASLTDIVAGEGWARTGTGGQIRIEHVLANLAETKLVGIAFTGDGQPLWCGRAKRLATVAQRHTTAAQDRGCVIPGCDQPVVRAQCHHIKEYAEGGTTDIDNLAWLCPYHHGRTRGWKLKRVHGRVWCTPPKHLDPDQVPKLNHTFHPKDLFTHLQP